jgi:hypothetical protein
MNTKADMMEQLSRTLQTERNELKEQLKELTSTTKPVIITNDTTNGESIVTDSNDKQTPKPEETVE